MIGTAVCTSRTNPLHLQPNGLVTMDYPTGQTTVASLQPDGSLATRPQGTAGPWECAERKTLWGVTGLLFRSFDQAVRFVPYLDE